MAKQYKLLYGQLWPSVQDELSIEFYMIKCGGHITRKSDGLVVGNGLFWHWKRAQQLLWPEKVWHKWNELQSQCYTQYRTIVVMGPASSGKTNTAATDALLDYYCYPSCTSIIICSTTRERLEDRIWGELKKYHRQARDRYSWLPGNLIEGRLRLVTDERSMSEEGRDFRNGIIGVPCFASGTMVDTLNGPIPIENIRNGDRVYNAVGCGTVHKSYYRFAQHLLRVTLSDGRYVDCTPEHPFFTNRGWVEASSLETLDMVLSPCETVPIVRGQPNGALPEQEILSEMLKFSSSRNLRQLRRDISACSRQPQHEEALQGAFLQQALCESVGCKTSAGSPRNEALQKLWKSYGIGAPQQEVLFHCLPEQTRTAALPLLWPSFSLDSGITRKAQEAILQSILRMEWNASPTTKEGCFSNARRTSSLEALSELDLELPFPYRLPASGRQSPMVQNGCGVSGCETGRGNRWRRSQDSCFDFEGQSSDSYFGGTRVDRVEVLESGGDPRFDESEGGYRVYNIEVTGHPSYSVNGMLVHNCKKGDNFIGMGDFAGIKNKRVRLIGDEISFLPKAFVDAISNLDKNEDFKAVGMGNPKDTTDALGVLAEPSTAMGGWESGIDQSPKTKTWPIRRRDGICVQLVGSDSPNLDGKLGIPIITQDQIDRDVEFYGRDSMQFSMMNEGRMPRGQSSHRVLTRAMCEKFKAFDEPIWRDTRIRKIAFMDAGYGGDRCIFGEMNFGQLASPSPMTVATIPLANNEPALNEHKQLIHLVDTLNVPVSADKGAPLPEDQIVNFVVAQLERRGISMDDFFYEPGMRTKLTVAFARITGKTGNPIDCMGKPTDRPVAEGIDVLCMDYYSKFVTELWYSVRLCVEAGQFRGMTDDAVTEFSAREWKKVAGNRIEVEPKEDMRKKMGRSPDVADAVAIGVEGARQRGFIIIKIGGDVQRKVMKDERWRTNARIQSEKAWHSHDLNYAV